jgi:hypothetical protein
MTVTDYRSSNVQQFTSSAAWVNLIDGQVNFTTSAVGCVSIVFSAVGLVTAQTGSGELRVRTLMDSNNLCMPAFASDDFVGSDDTVSPVAASITHICKNVAAGAHAVQVQFTSTGGQNVSLSSQVLSVTHN